MAALTNEQREELAGLNPEILRLKKEQGRTRRSKWAEPPTTVAMVITQLTGANKKEQVGPASYYCCHGYNTFNRGEQEGAGGPSLLPLLPS
eukprot:2658165-Pyramimonas_sp.AAC.1